MITGIPKPAEHTPNIAYYNGNRQEAFTEELPFFASAPRVSEGFYYEIYQKYHRGGADYFHNRERIDRAEQTEKCPNGCRNICNGPIHDDPH